MKLKLINSFIILLSMTLILASGCQSEESPLYIINGLKVTQIPRSTSTITITGIATADLPPQTITITAAPITTTVTATIHDGVVPPAPVIILTPSPIVTVTQYDPFSTAILMETIFSWNAYTGATLYEVQLSKDINFLSGVYTKTAISNQLMWDSPLDSSATYYWRVRASTSKGITEWAQSSFIYNATMTTVTNTVVTTVPPNTITVTAPATTITQTEYVNEPE